MKTLAAKLKTLPKIRRDAITHRAEALAADHGRFVAVTARGSPVYHCCHCGAYVGRASTKQWVPSYCDRTGRRVHLVRVADPPRVRAAATKVLRQRRRLMKRLAR